ncbi:MAG: SAVED domain-containing protein [Rhodobacteraceae bacterium]|nr:SAVED domain-containing protein [Paracoccaceae bacterium]
MNLIVSRIDYAFRKAIDYIFRPISSSRYLISCGVLLIAPSGLLWTVTASIQVEGTTYSTLIHVGESGSTIIFALGFIALIIGIFFETYSLFLNGARDRKKRIVVIELRGLRSHVGTPLIDAIPKYMAGQRVSRLISLPQINDGEVASPETAIKELATLTTDLKQGEFGHNRSDLSRVFGGLAPVPILFLAGVLVDDECDLKIMDWDRHKKTWRELDSIDDHNRFTLPDLDAIPNFSDEIILTISASYAVNMSGAIERVGVLPVVQLDLKERSFDSHWSEEKQVALTKEFCEVIRKLADKQIKKIHLFIAAPASLSFRFGTSYDKRNMPTVVVYQHAQNHTPPFSWGIEMPVAGKSEATIVVDADADGNTTSQVLLVGSKGH